MVRWLVLLVVLAACGGGEGDESATNTTGPPETTSTPAAAPRSGCADVVDLDVQSDGDATFRFSVTVRSADTGWEKYADAWEVRAPDGTVLATRILAHPHVDEQPFTRSLSGVRIPEDISEVSVAARDLVEGFCGRVESVALPGRTAAGT